METVVYNPNRLILILSSKERYAIKGVEISEEEVNEIIRTWDPIVAPLEKVFYLTGYAPTIEDFENSARNLASMIEDMKDHPGWKDEMLHSLTFLAEQIVAYKTMADAWHRNAAQHKSSGKARYEEQLSRCRGNMDDIPDILKAVISEETRRAFDYCNEQMQNIICNGECDAVIAIPKEYVDDYQGEMKWKE